MSSLGKGLGALIPNADKPETGSEVKSKDVVTLPVDKIASNPYQPRTTFDTEPLEDLARSIKEHGVLQPLVVSPGDGETYELIAGERRLKASKQAGLTEVPVIIRKAEDHEKLELALVENIQRQNLNPLDEAASYQKLMDEFNLSQEEIGHKVGKSRSTIANFLRLKNLPEEVKQALKKDQISFSHAKTILALENRKDQLALLKRIITDKVPVAQLQREQMLVKSHTRNGKDPLLVQVEDTWTRTLGSKVRIKKQGSGGTIEINWDSEEDLKRLTDQIS